MIASSDEITEINGDPSLRGQHSGFYVRVLRPDFWLCEAGYILPGIPGTSFPMAVNSGPEGSSNFPACE